jgi:hypothetical protein
MYAIRPERPDVRPARYPLTGAETSPRGRPRALREAGRFPWDESPQLLLAVWIALSVVSTATVAAGVAGVPVVVCVQLTVAG